MAYFSRIPKSVVQRKLGVFICTALVVGNMVGSGIFLLPSALAASGPLSIFGWLLSASVALALSVIYARLIRRRIGDGGPYYYCRHTFGDRVGFMVGWTYWVALVVGNAAVAVAFSDYFTHFFPVETTSEFINVFVALLLLWGLTLVNMRSVFKSGQLVLVVTVLKLIPLIALAIFGWFFIDTPRELVVAPMAEKYQIGVVAALTFWAFIGLESATVPSSMVRHAKATVPIATIVGVLLTALIYIMVTEVTLQALPAEVLSNAGAPLMLVGEELWGRAGAVFLGFAGLFALFGALNGFILLVGFLGMSIAQDGLFPSYMAKREEQTQTPAKALLVSGIVSSVFIIIVFYQQQFNEFGLLAVLATVAMVVPYGVSSLCELTMAMRASDWRFNSFFVPLLLALFIIGYLVWTVMETRQFIAPWLGGLVFSGLCLHWVHSWLRKRKATD